AGRRSPAHPAGGSPSGELVAPGETRAGPSRSRPLELAPHVATSPPHPAGDPALANPPVGRGLGAEDLLRIAGRSAVLAHPGRTTQLQPTGRNVDGGQAPGGMVSDQEDAPASPTGPP